MANQKQGLDYFDFSVDFFDDDKIALTEARFGIKGSYIAIRLLTKLYRFGFFLQWGEDEAALFAHSIGNGISASLVKDVVGELVKRAFFDKRIFDSFQVLTSKGIQARYFNAIKRRTPINVDARYLLVDISKLQNVNIMYAESKIMSTESKIMYAESAQSRVDNIRVEQSREEAPPQTPPHDKREVGVSESRGGAFSFSSIFYTAEQTSIRSALASAEMPEADIWEFCRLVTAPDIKAGYGTNMAKYYKSLSPAQRKKYPFYEVLQGLQNMERSGRITPAINYDDFHMQQYIATRLSGSDSAAICRTLGTPPHPMLLEELRRLVKECTRPGNSITQPGKFILAGLRKLLQNKVV